MIIRVLTLSLALALTACGESNSPAAKSDANSSGNELPLAADLLATEPLAGAWAKVGDDATTGVRFTPKSYPDTLTIGCNGGTYRAFINWTVKDQAQNGEVRIYTAAKTVAFAATGSNYGADHILGIEVEGTDPRLAVLKTEQKSFAVQGFGQAIVVPWDKSIAAALNECVG